MANFKKHVLENGLRVITLPVKETKTVAVLILVGTGSKYESKEINGLSHFLEHIFFKGTKKRPNTLAISETLDRVGGKYNAFTSQEYTGYWAKVAADHFDLALDWTSDIFLNSKIPEQEIQREKGVILEEINMHLDNPMSLVADLWMDILYGNQPAGWRVLGTKQVVQSLQRDHFLKYLKDHYSSQNTIIVIAGRVSHGSALTGVKKYFKTINTGNVKDKVAVKEGQTKPRALVHYRATDQSHLCLGVRGYDIFHPDRYTLDLLGVILGGNMSSRLFISIRERQGLAYYISTGVSMDTDTGFLFTRAGVDNKRIEQAIKSILKEYSKIAHQKVSSSEIRKAKDSVKGGALIDMESSDAQASFVGMQELLTGKILTLEQEFAKIEKVTVNDIQRVAKDVFRLNRLNLALVGPFKDKSKFEKLLDI